MARKISAAGISLIKSFEGCRLTAYKPIPTERYYTIGYGHYGPDVAQGMTITQQQAEDLLRRDLAKYEAYVNNPAYVPITGELNQNQFDALVSFCYNCGAGNLRMLCANRTAEKIAQSLPRYNKAGGVVLAGLVRRREAELALFQKEDATKLTKFKDVPAGHWAESAIKAVNDAGIMNGVDKDSFEPDRAITRAEAAAMIAKLLKEVKEHVRSD